MATTSTIFITATEARQNPYRERAVHDEGRGIESEILDAVRDGLYNVTVDGGTPMTQSATIVAPVSGIGVDDSTFYIPNHPFSQGELVSLNSTGTLPYPLKSTSFYYVIYMDANHIKLADSLRDATANKPIYVLVSNGVNSITLTEQGSGYMVAPTVTISGGDPSVPARALAYLASYGNVNEIGVISTGSGYTDVPSVVINPQGTGATVGTVTFKVVYASIYDPGMNYRVGDTMTVQGGTGVSTTLLVNQVSSSGEVVAVSISNAGSYSILPNLSNVSTTVNPGGGNGCTVNLVMGINTISVTDGGYGYTANPKVLISDLTGTGAEAVALVNAGMVTSITVTNSGSGYVSTPTITLTSGYGAEAIAVLQPTGIGSITLLTDGGNTYTSVPTVDLVPSGTGAAAGQVYVRVSSARLVYNGTGYTAGDILLVAGGAGATGATIQVATVGSYGEIVEWTLLTGGLYRQIPVLDNNSVVGGTGSAASFDLTLSLDSVDLEFQGSGYASPPTVTVTSSTGYGAQIIAMIESGSVTDLRVIASGTEYREIPVVSISNGGGSIAQARLFPTGVSNVSVSDGGTGYTTASVTIEGNGEGATAVANISGGSIVSIDMVTQGSGYTYPPSVVISGDGSNASAVTWLVPTSVEYIELIAGGDGYTSSPAVVISGAATAMASLNQTGIDRIDVTVGGEYYTSNPVVNVIPSPYQEVTPVSPATTVSRGFSVDHITITNPGSNYQTVPTVTLNAPQDLNGVIATAEATIGIGEGSITMSLYSQSKDYYAAWKGTTMSNEDLRRPYIDRMDTIVSYFTNMGYTITRQTNPTTGNTIQWAVKW